jgi:hypothetical protein
MKTVKHILFFLLAGLTFSVFTGCEKNDDGGDNPRNIKGTGPVVSKTFTLDAFSKIQNTGVADVYVTLGSPQSVELHAQQNIIDVMTIGVNGDELQIGLENGVSIEEAEEIRFDITIPSITSLNLTGVGDFILSGDYQDNLTIVITGVGNVKAFDLEVGTCDITITGIGDCEVHVKNQLDVSITGVGKVYYKGSPSITSSISGVGALVDAN